MFVIDRLLAALSSWLLVLRSASLRLLHGLLLAGSLMHPLLCTPSPPQGPLTTTGTHPLTRALPAHTCPPPGPL